MPAANGDNLLPAGEVAFTEVPPSHQQFPEILDPYDAIWNWAKKEGREFDGPAREVYYDEERWEIVWPLR